MKYILTTTARRKNAKRHIADRSADIEKLRTLGKNMTRLYVVEIYNSKWELIETVTD